MSKESAQAMQDLRKFMFANLYNNPVAKSEEKKAKAMLKQLYFYYMEHIEEIPSLSKKSYVRISLSSLPVVSVGLPFCNCICAS